MKSPSLVSNVYTCVRRDSLLKLYTSYYAKLSDKSCNIDIEKCISISITRAVPMPVLREVVPTPYTFSSKSDPDEFARRYYLQLSKLDPYEILDKIRKLVGDEAILLCWEGPDKFCHRHILVKWIYYHTGIIINELGVTNY